MNEILEKIKKYSKPVGTGAEVKNFSSVEKSTADLVQTFKFEFERVGGNFLLSDSPQSVIDKIGEVFGKISVGKVILGRNVEQIFLNELKNNFPKIVFNTLDSVSDLIDLKKIISTSDVAISFADYLISETGTIVVISKNEEARSLSILTPVNIVIADKTVIVPDMQTLLKDISVRFGEKIPHSAIIFITGPSRTADIEKILIIGVHGPGELFVILK